MSYYNNENHEKSSEFNAFEMSIRENISFQASAFEKCNSEINDIADRLKNLKEASDALRGLQAHIEKMKSVVHDDVFKKEICFIHKEIEEMHMKIRDISDMVSTHSAYNRKLMEESKVFASNIYNENQMIYNMTKAIGNDCKQVYQQMRDDNKLIAGLDLSKLADTHIKKIESIGNSIDEMENIANNAAISMKRQNAIRMTMMILFAVVATILVAFTLSIIIIFK